MIINSQLDIMIKLFLDNFFINIIFIKIDILINLNFIQKIDQ